MNIVVHMRGELDAFSTHLGEHVLQPGEHPFGAFNIREDALEEPEEGAPFLDGFPWGF